MSVEITDLSANLPEPQRRAVREEYRRSARSATTAFLLCFFLGIFGAHRFYLGQPRQGLLRLVLSPLILPGLIWEIIDLFRIDREVERDNLTLAEQLIARAALSVPLSAAALAQAPHVVAATAPAAPVAVASIWSPAVEPDELVAAPDSTPAPPIADRPSSVPPSPSTRAIAASTPEEESPPLWPYMGDTGDAVAVGDAEPAPFAGGSDPLAAESLAAAPTSSPAWAMDPDPDVAAMPPTTDPAPAQPATTAGQDREPAATMAPLAVVGTLAGAAALMAAESATPPPPVQTLPDKESPDPEPSAPPEFATATRLPDFTDRGAPGEAPSPAADIGEGTGARLRVVLSQPASGAEPAVEDPFQQPETPAPTAASAVVFVADPTFSDPTVYPASPTADTGAQTAPEAEAQTASAALDPAMGATAAAFAAAAAEPELWPSAPAQHDPAALPAAPPPLTSSPPPTAVPDAAAPAAPAGDGQTRMVKRVRVVRRLVVDGKVVHEAIAEQVVDPEVDTAATATSLQEALRSGDGPRIAALTGPLRLNPPDEEASTDAAPPAPSEPSA